MHIDGKLRAYLHNNRLVLALAPGEYTLTGISRYINYGTSTSTTSLPVERPFEIKPGKVTNLGLILFDFDSLDYRKFYTYSLDNTASARRHLRASHPGLAATLGPDDFLSAPATYVAPDKLELLRKGLATRPSFYGKLKKADQDPRIVAGPAGIIAEHVVKDGKIVDIKVHETNTLSAAVDRSEHGEQNLIAMADGGLFLLSKGQLQALNAPADAAPLVRAELLPAGMLLVDERLRVFWTTDAGRSWARYTEAELAPTEATGDIHVAKGPQELFVYNRSRPAHILHSPTDRFAISSVPVPLRGHEQIDTMTPRGSGVFLRPNNVTRTLHFRPVNSGEWEELKGPAAFCLYDYADEAGNTLTAKCGMMSKNKKYRSTDGGRTWTDL